MSAVPTYARSFEPGTTGWSADDLLDPEIDRLFQDGRFEIVEGVLTQMPAALYDGSLSLQRLLRIIERHLDQYGLPGEFSTEVDLVIGKRRVLRADAVFLLPEDQRRQKEAHRHGGDPAVTFGRLVVPPTLIVESLSLGHESHDRETKRQWFAQWRVPNYWMLNAYERTVECLVLDGDGYRTDVAGRGGDEVKPTLFAGLRIQLLKLWA
ncbi:MAG: Uma2 family endonuclease [Tepidisphaeraceae bacterium]|jgi:Uma2 family endonuclease